MKSSTLSTFAILLILGATLVSCGGMRQMVRNADDIRMEANPNLLEVHSDSIEVEIRGQIPESYLRRKFNLSFEPTLMYDGGEYPLREYVIAGEEAEGVEADQVIQYKQGGSFTIRDKFPYESAMRTSTLCMVLNIRKDTDVRTLRRCQEEPHDTLAVGTKVIAGTVQATDDILFSGDREPRKMKRNAVVHFEINRAEVRSSEKESESIQAVWEFAETPMLVLKSINIDSYASPDGPQRLNERLSGNRDENSYGFLKSKLLDLGHEEVHDSNFYRETTDEDWKGFTTAVRKDNNVPEKDWVLDVLNSDKGLDEKEKELKENEEVWEYFAENSFPPLRRSDIDLSGEVAMRHPDEIAEVGAESLDSLNNRELLVYAYNLDDHDEEMAVHQYFVERFPDDWAGYGNVARMHLMAGDLEQAEENLNKALEINGNEGSLLNNKAVLQRRQGKYYEAAETLAQAQQAGVDVSNNMGIVNINLANYDEAVSSFPADQCDYNAALARLLTDDRAGAIETVDCIADKDGADFYLRAVAAARDGNFDLLTTSLSRAIEHDGSFRELAQDDLEFAGYRNREAFRNAIR